MPNHGCQARYVVSSGEFEAVSFEVQTSSTGARSVSFERRATNFAEAAM